MKNKLTKDLKKFVPNFLKTDKHGFNYTVTELVQLSEKIEEAMQWHGQVLSNEILKYKTSDKIFILGSGPSINLISNQEWEHIAKHDSIGFNYWLAHNFIPNIYLFQLFESNSLFNLLKDKLNQYKNVPFIIRGSQFAKYDLYKENNILNLFKENPIYYLKEYPVHSQCSIDINLLIKYMDALGYMEFGNITKFIPKWRGTLGLLLMLAYQMGYKKIILCGVDMHQNDHFWDYKPYLYLKEKYSLPKLGKHNIDQFKNLSYSPNTVPEYIYHLNNWFQNKNNVSIFVFSKQTILYPKIPLYQLNE